MRRVSSATANNDIQYNLRLQESRVNNLNNQLGSQNRLQQLRDDPLAAGHLVRYQSYATRVEQFEKNAKIHLINCTHAIILSFCKPGR